MTTGIQELLDKKLIQVTDYLNYDLTEPFKHKKAKIVYYPRLLENKEINAFYIKKKLPKYIATERITDKARIDQIRTEQERK
ncbi:hypothetical protein [Polaribacter sp. Hel_I_88]|uniref:hypothetical protein n=1 Tax=Polaribacter sp. Hel_I_88 TaxID=1250006 RepID=UPI000479E48D|nr:hypothetical protein [Polaribacter sp. Hel_I_88]